MPQITQCVSPNVPKGSSAAASVDENENNNGAAGSGSKDNPISIVHLNGSTLFSAQSTPFSAYSASNQN